MCVSVQKYVVNIKLNVRKNREVCGSSTCVWNDKSVIC